MGLGPVIKDLAKAAEPSVKELAGSWWKDEAPAYYTRTIKMLQKTPSGTDLAEHLQKEWEPALKKEGQKIFDAKVISPKTNKPVDPSEALAIAHTKLKDDYIGRNGEALIISLRGMAKERSIHYAREMADALGVYFHDQEQYWRKNAIKKGVLPEAIGTSGKYRPPTIMEGDIKHAISLGLTSKIAIPHASQFMNFFFEGGSFKEVLKGLNDIWFSKDKEFFKNEVVKSGAMIDELMYEANKVGKNSYIDKFFHSPGFTAVRKFQINWGATVGRHVALDSAERYVKTGSKVAENELKILGIDPQEVLKNKGELSEDHLLKAMYRFVDDTMFNHSELGTPYKWHENTAMRYATMYKDFAIREGGLIKDAGQRAWKEGPASFLRFVGIMTVLAPEAGFLVRAAENLVSGHPATERTFNPTGIKPVDEYLDLLGHLGGLGINYGIMRAAKRHAMAAWFGGPVAGIAGDLSQDVYNGDVTSLTRDILKRLSWPGAMAANILMPTQAQERQKRLERMTPLERYKLQQRMEKSQKTKDFKKKYGVKPPKGFVSPN